MRLKMFKYIQEKAMITIEDVAADHLEKRLYSTGCSKYIPVQGPYWM